MDPRCSVVRPTNKLSLTASAAMIAFIGVISFAPTLVEARGKAKAAPSPQTQNAHGARSNARNVARSVIRTRRATPIALNTTSSPMSGPAAIRAANVEALAPSRADGFMNAAQVFPYETGRVFEIWTAPLRITTISLEQGETITNKAAGDTQRWMIGDTTSGSGATLQTHILVKPFKAGIATNMVVTTNRRVYLLSLRAAEGADAFNAAVTWTHPLPFPTSGVENVGLSPFTESGVGRTAQIATLNQNYRIKAGWRRPPWTPLSVSDDGRQTFITFPETLGSSEAPPLFVMNDTGEAQQIGRAHV